VLLIASLALAATGCVGTLYTKEVIVTKDATGNVIKTVVTETATQRGYGSPIPFEHLKGVQQQSLLTTWCQPGAK
jgi:hypothetical protein